MINKQQKKRIFSITMALLVIVLMFSGCSYWYLTSTATGGRIGKNFKSEVDNGLPRDIKVYNADGKLIMEEKGKFDIQHSNRSLQYIDQHNRKHNIYFGDNTTVTVDELK